MNITKSFPQSLGRASAGKQRALILFGFVALAAIVVGAAKLRWTSSSAADHPISNEQPNPNAEPVVKLSADKLRSAELHFAPCQVRELREVRTVPGKITYNESNHLVIKSPVEGVVLQVLVTPKQKVRKGDRLAVLTSPEVGTARDSVCTNQAELQLAQMEADRTEQIASNLVELLQFLKGHPDPAAIDKSFDDKQLGEHREEIISAYSKSFYADAVVADTRALAESGAISGRLQQERLSSRETCKATFDTACEQSRFEVTQARDRTRAAVEHAERMLAVSRQRLTALAGGDPSATECVPENVISELVLQAPFEGTIVERMAVPSARISAGQPLFALANLDTLWVSAEVHERDWNALDGEAQHELVLHAPSLSNSETAARVKFMEAKISPETHSIAIVGELDNRNQKLRPGMFVWASLPVGQSRQALAVPASAIVQHEQSRFVFVADGVDTFRRIDVETGVETPDWVEITDGLTAGQSVVDAGAFALKSELLLEHESE